MYQSIYTGHNAKATLLEFRKRVSPSAHSEYALYAANRGNEYALVFNSLTEATKFLDLLSRQLKKQASEETQEQQC